MLPALGRALDRLLPPVLRQAPPELRLRARFLAVLALFSLVPMLPMLIANLCIGQSQIIVPASLRTAMVVLALILLWRRGRIELPGHLLLGAALVFLVWGAHDLRALFPLMGMGVLPTAALLLCGRRAGWIWLCTTCATSTATVLILDIRVEHLDALVPAILAPVQLAVVVFALGWLYDVLKRRALHELEQQSFRMISLDTLSAGVAHEINNPLAFSMANVQLLGVMLRDIEHLLPETQPAELREILADTSDGLSRIRRIVLDLSTFSRSGDDKGEGRDRNRSAVDVRAVVEAAVNLAQSQLGQHARLVRDYQPVPPVTASEPQLAQVFLNLLINAAQAIPAGARAANEVAVRTGADEQGRAFVEVRDTGVGIPAEHLPLLFDPFFTTRPHGEGMGLGLSICHGIVAQLGGEITVQSEVGQGSTFRVALPASVAPAASMHARLHPDQHAAP